MINSASLGDPLHITCCRHAPDVARSAGTKGPVSDHDQRSCHYPTRLHNRPRSGFNTRSGAAPRPPGALQSGILRIRRQDEHDELDGIIAELDQADAASAKPRILALRNRQQHVVVVLEFLALDLQPAERVLIVRVAYLHGPSEIDHGLIVDLFGLSLAEARVVALLCARKDATGAATLLGVGTETVRTLIKRARHKLGVNSQTAMLTMLHNATALAAR